MRQRIERVLGALEQAQVRYLVVGGVAVVLHGHLRTTLDLDLVIQLEGENVQRALDVFLGLGFEPRVPVPLKAFAERRNRESWRQEKNMTVFSLWKSDEPGFVVDLFVEEPFDFQVVYERALIVPLQRTNTKVISLSDLIEMKEAAGRSQDLQDVEALREIARQREEPHA